jgi:hypothetical protein
MLQELRRSDCGCTTQADAGRPPPTGLLRMERTHPLHEPGELGQGLFRRYLHQNRTCSSPTHRGLSGFDAGDFLILAGNVSLDFIPVRKVISKRRMNLLEL